MTPPGRWRRRFDSTRTPGPPLPRSDTGHAVGEPASISTLSKARRQSRKLTTVHNSGPQYCIADRSVGDRRTIALVADVCAWMQRHALGGNRIRPGRDSSRTWYSSWNDFNDALKIFVETT